MLPKVCVNGLCVHITGQRKKRQSGKKKEKLEQLRHWQTAERSTGKETSGVPWVKSHLPLQTTPNYPGTNPRPLLCRSLFSSGGERNKNCGRSTSHRTKHSPLWLLHASCVGAADVGWVSHDGHIPENYFGALYENKVSKSLRKTRSNPTRTDQ